MPVHRRDGQIQPVDSAWVSTRDEHSQRRERGGDLPQQSLTNGTYCVAVTAVHHPVSSPSADRRSLRRHPVARLGIERHRNTGAAAPTATPALYGGPLDRASAAQYGDQLVLGQWQTPIDHAN